MLSRIDAVATEFLASLREREDSHDHPDARQRFGAAYAALTDLAANI